MNQRKILDQKIKEFEIQEFVSANLKGVGLSTTKLVPTPLGEKIIIYASRPGLVVGRKGQSIKKLTMQLKKRFNLENPQIEIAEVENVNLDADIVAERIANSLERFGLARFKGVGHKTMADVMAAGALGIEIIISGKVPSSRAKRWRFYQGYLKKCGQIAIDGVKKSYKTAQLKTGTIGIVVSIMPPDLKLPDDVEMNKPVESEGPAPAPEAPKEEPKRQPKKRKAKPKEEAAPEEPKGDAK
jgi:small subunit ribosomal protein S3